MKKVLVLDLDNTLWGGVVGEDGFDGIALGTQAPGNSYLAFQQAILDCYNRGVVLAINSRNNPDEALKVLREHPNMILKEPHFAATRINWDDKVENMKALATELNLGLDSFVFLDDDPTNRAAMRAMLPQVEVPELPQDPTEYTPFFLGLNYFEGGEVTDEDKLRGNMYVTERLRIAEEQAYSTREGFLKSLLLNLQVFKNDESCLERLAQLTDRTNQFNTNKVPMSAEEIKALMHDGKHAVYHARLIDRFGDYGVIIVAIVETSKEWRISTMLMSCRVFGRGVEEALLSIIEKDAGVSVSLDFVPTAKNQPAKDFIEKYCQGGVCNTIEVPPWIKTSFQK
jgi:FkbH-like protein